MFSSARRWSDAFRRRKVRPLRTNRGSDSRRLMLERLEERRLLAGGGQNILLVVNPDDENALRIANAYQELRDIPDSNIVFITPATSSSGFQFALSKQTFYDSYVTPIASAIASRGLTDQIDYIATLGEPTSYVSPSYYGADTRNSFTYGMMLLSELSNGLNSDYAVHKTTGLYVAPSTISVGSNSAIHHSQHYNVYYGSAGYVDTQYYMAGTLANTWIRGNTADQVIANLQRTVAADGTHPTGTIYFEENDDVRSNTRESQWSTTKTQLTARGVSYLEERNTSGATPLNRTDVLGAVIGSAGHAAPNGSTYVAGSWVDNLTSCGAMLDDRSQSKDSRFIAAGAAATCGSIVEPYADSNRFTNSSVHVFLADGSTAAEAFAKSVATPDIQLFMGDLLSQPQADIPDVSITAGPAEGSTVSGTVSLSASASLTGAQIATGVETLELLVDGRTVDTIDAASGTFSFDTTTLTDGRHELRVVAINNAAAESEGDTAVNVTVNNHGRSVSVAGGDVSVTGSQTVPLSVSASAGNGTVVRIELRNLGRSLGQVTGASGTITLDSSKLAYFDSVVTPVAVYSDGTETAGTPITVTRTPAYLTGQSTSPNTTTGLKIEYFYNQGNTTIATSDFTGDPDLVGTTTKVNLFSGLTYVDANSVTQKYTGLDQTPVGMTAADINNLAVRVSGRFNVSAVGEYQFYLWRTNDSAAIYVDGQRVCGFDNAQSGSSTNQVGSVYLGQGEHEVVILAANTVTTTRAEYFDISAEYRGPDGVTRVMDSSTFFTQVNNAPTLTATGSQTLTAISEDAVSNAGDLVANIVAGTIEDIDPGSLAGIALQAVTSGRGEWQYSTNAGANWIDVGEVTLYEALLLRGNDKLRFVPDALNADSATITYCAWDQTSGYVGMRVDSSLGGETWAFSTASDTASLTILATNDPPTGADAARTIAEDGTYTFALADFAFADSIDVPANVLARVRITTAPSAGSVQLDGTALAAGQSVSVAEISAGRCTFVPAANGNGSPYTTFTFQVGDDGGTDYGGVDLDTTPNTFTMSVTPLNDPPAGTDTVKIATEDSSCFLTASDFGFTDSNDQPSNTFYQVLITTLPAAGTLKLSGVAVSAGQYVTVTDLGLLRLKYTPPANASGTAYTSFTFQVQDNGGTTGGVADLDPTPNTLTFNLTAVGDAPAGTDGTITAMEDQAYAMAAASFGLTDPIDSPPNALYRVLITTLPAAGTLKLNSVAVTAGQTITVADMDQGLFTFTAASNASASPYTSFTFQVQDDGGTANGGVDLDPTPNTLTINVTAVNDPPTIGALGDTPDPATVGQLVTLTATGVADSLDATGTVVRLDFYRESNDTAGLQTGSGGDTLVGSDTNGGDGWSASASTTDLSPGSYTYYAQATDNEGAVSAEGTAAASTANTLQPIYNLDADGNGSADALTDGILVLRYLFDPSGAWNYSDALGSGATRTTRAAIRSFLDGGRSTVLDADGNATADALTDGILILRYLFDPSGAWNYSDALGSGATRTTRAAIRAYLNLYNPANASSAAAGAIDSAVTEAAVVATEANTAEVAVTGVAQPTGESVEVAAPLETSAAVGTGESTTVGIGCHPERSEGSSLNAWRSFAALRMTVVDSSALGETDTPTVTHLEADPVGLRLETELAPGGQPEGRASTPTASGIETLDTVLTGWNAPSDVELPTIRLGVALAFAGDANADAAADELFAAAGELKGCARAGYDSRSIRTERSAMAKRPSRSAEVFSFRLS